MINKALVGCLYLFVCKDAFFIVVNGVRGSALDQPLFENKISRSDCFNII